MNAHDFDRFAVVFLAPAAVRAAVEALQAQLPPAGRPMLPAHVTIKGTFVEPTDLVEIASRIRHWSLATPPCSLRTTEVDLRQDDQHTSIWLRVAAVETVTALHWALVEALADLCRTVYSTDLEGHFAPHLTLVEQTPVTMLAHALTIIDRIQPCYSFVADRVSLVGRRGGLVWEELASFPMRAE